MARKSSSGGGGRGSRKQSAAGRGKPTAARQAEPPSVPDPMETGQYIPVGSAIPRAEAVERLKEAAACLSRTPQGEGSELAEYGQAAAAEEFMRHPDREVRLWAAKCLAETLRIFAPEPPFDAQQLGAVLELFLEHLRLLAKPAGAEHELALNFISRLVEVQAFMLVFDSEEPERLLQALVNSCLEVGRSVQEGQPEGLLAQLLTAILGEAEPEILRPVLLSLFQELLPTRKQNVAAGLVRRVLGGLANRSAAVTVNDCMNAVLFEELSAHEKFGGEAKNSEHREALMGVVYELYTLDLALVARVLPNLQADLQSSNLRQRHAATSLIGRMLAFQATREESSTAKPLATTHPLLLDQHLERLDDADEGVRLAALDGAAAVLISAVGSGSSTAVASAARSYRQRLAKRCLDPSDAVRLRVVEIATEVALGSMGGLEFLEPVLQDIFRRILDKRPAVREACAEAVVRLYAKYALPAVIEGRCSTADSLAWIPQLTCEAYAIFLSGNSGLISQLEEHVEQHVLGCGASLTAERHARALLAFHKFASGTTEGAQGFELLLARKKAANSALQRFLRLRLAKAAPIAEVGASPGVVEPTSGKLGVAPTEAEAMAALGTLGRLSPTLEDRTARADTFQALLRGFDAVRDRELWESLDRLSSPGACISTTDLAAELGALDRLLRVHKLTGLAPLLRRALLTTWLLPDQVPELLACWRGAVAEGGSAERDVFRALAKSFPGAVLQHVGEIVPVLLDGAPQDALAAMRALGTLGKHTIEEPEAAGRVDPALVTERKPFVAALLRVIAGTGSAPPACSSACRKAVRACALLGKVEQWAAVEELMRWAEERSTPEGDEEPSALALHLAAACFERFTEASESPEAMVERAGGETWLSVARSVHLLGPKASASARCAAVELCAALRVEAELLAMAAPPPLIAADASDEAAAGGKLQPRHLCAATLRGARRGTLPVTTQLLCLLAAQFLSGIASNAEAQLVVLRKLSKSAARRTRLADRIRLCTSLPALFALAPGKQPRNVAQGLLTASLVTVLRQSMTRQEPLLDFTVACFLHFLSRLDCFLEEAAAAASSYPESTKIASFFSEALMRADQTRSGELAGILLRVCDRVRYFVDREQPGSDAVHRAAHVLRFVVERRCPDRGAAGTSWLVQAAARGSMPAELFTTRSEVSGGKQAALESGAHGERGAPLAVEGGTVPALVGASPAAAEAAPASMAWLPTEDTKERRMAVEPPHVATPQRRTNRSQQPLAESATPAAAARTTGKRLGSLLGSGSSSRSRRARTV